jgi:Rho GDP-dissociation inhibitor
VDKLDQMLGSYGPSATGEPYNKDFPPEVCKKPSSSSNQGLTSDHQESPSGLIARSGTYVVKSRVVDDDNEIYAGTYIINNPRSWL